MQSTASHLEILIALSLLARGLIAYVAYGENLFRRGTSPYWPIVGFQLAGVVVAIVVIYLYGHDILNALVISPFGPSDDDLRMVSHD